MTSAVPKTYEQARDWCWEHNQTAREKGFRHWIIATRTGDGFTIKTITGDEAREIWLMFDDKPLVPRGWGEVEVAKMHRLTAWRLEHGVTPDVWMLWCQEARVKKRLAYVAGELGSQAA